jgi:hypothetical protein
MTAAASFQDPERWRQRAEQIRTLGNEMDDARAREMMLQIAHDYERLAVRAEERLARVRQPDGGL